MPNQQNSESNGKNVIFSISRFYKLISRKISKFLSTLIKTFRVKYYIFSFLSISGENATLSCSISSVPSSKIHWYRDGTEILNNSLVNRGQQQFIIHETGDFEKSSTLVLTQARPEDSGPFMCVSQNQAGRVEANFTLQVLFCKRFCNDLNPNSFGVCSPVQYLQVL